MVTEFENPHLPTSRDQRRDEVLSDEPTAAVTSLLRHAAVHSS